MRWIVGSLVAVNIVVLIWQLLTQQPEASPALPPARQLQSDAPSIKLLSELEEETLQAMMANRQRVRLSPAPAAEVEAPLCTLVGPFEKLLRAEYFVERLQALERYLLHTLDV